MKKLSAVVIGYGMRGEAYSKYAIEHPDVFEVAAVAEPEITRRNFAKEKHNLSPDRVFSDFRELENKPRLADFAIIGTQDAMHLEPALLCIEKGYDILLEKPIAPTARECKIITEAAEKKGVKVVVCHVLRFTDFWYKLKDILDSGKIGEIISIIHMENVGHTHQAHSFVRGNWGNSKKSAPMILAKSCHDTDILQWIVGKKCKRVQSFGSLSHFTHENRPKGAPDRCTDGCPYADTCFYNAVEFYQRDYIREIGWADVAADEKGATNEKVLEALKTGPYGRCVYACDNDVVDHQVVNFEFEGGITASFTMSAFNEGGRNIRIFGTKGELTASMSTNEIEIFSFDTLTKTVYQLDKVGEHIGSGHGGGDFGIMRDVINYFGGISQSKSISDIRTSYLNHIIAFAAEVSRLEGTVIDIDEFSNNIEI